MNTPRISNSRARRSGPSLERDSAHSLYEQILDRLREHLGGELAPGDQAPTEEFLTRQYGVSRSTVRKALDRLVAEGLLVRRQGKGTFVARPLPRIVHSIDRLAPFLETFRQFGEDVRVEVTRFDWIDEPDLPAELQAWQRPVLCYERRYLLRGVPHAITRITVPHDIGRRITREDVDRRPIYELLKKKLKLELRQAQFLVSCRQPSPASAQALEISQSAYLLVLDRITRDANGTPVETTTHLLRPDVYQLSVVLDDLHKPR
ncbi:MAG TPA: GntR family transcriptional regulator [Burkholderiaceae bacterium]|nr:GntR family transcriptional regulator [Burkholderiaceae bacterium]